MEYLELNTNKFYYGSTILLVGYKHDEFGYKFTTISSSYTIDNQIILGLGTNGDAYKQIKKYNNFSVNIIGHSNIDLIEAGAQNPGEDRFKLNPKIEYVVDREYDIPLIDGVLAQFICTKTEDFYLQSNASFVNVAANINKRLFSEKLLSNGKIDKSKLDTVLFYNDVDGEFIK